MTPGQVVQRGHGTIIASGTEIIPGCAIDHIHWSSSARRRTGGPGPGYGAAWCPAAPATTGSLDLASNDYLGLCARPAAGRGRGRGGPGLGHRIDRLPAGHRHDRAARPAGDAAGRVHRRRRPRSCSPPATWPTWPCSPRWPRPGGAGGRGADRLRRRATTPPSIDGCRLARGARVEVTPHRDVDAVRHALAGRGEAAAIVVTDAVFSVDGDPAPLRELHAVARDHGALLVIDEAHALGVMGPGGRGAALRGRARRRAGRDPDRHAVQVAGRPGRRGAGRAGGDRDAGRHRPRRSSSTPAWRRRCAGAALAALDVLEAEPELACPRPGRRDPAGRDRRRPGPAVRPPAPPCSRSSSAARRGPPRPQRICAGHGVRVGCFRPPSVPRGHACLRLAARASLTENDFATAVRALAAVRDMERVDVHLLVKAEDSGDRFSVAGR